MTGLELDTLTIASLDDIRYEPGRVTVLEKNWLDGKSPPFGECTLEDGTASFLALETALEAVKRGVCHGILFAPLNKQCVRLGGRADEDALAHNQQIPRVQGVVTKFKKH